MAKEDIKNKEMKLLGLTKAICVQYLNDDYAYIAKS